MLGPGRPKPSKLASDPRLREEVQARLAPAKWIWHITGTPKARGPRRGL